VGEKEGAAVPFLSFVSWIRCRTQRSGLLDRVFLNPRSLARIARRRSLAPRPPRWSRRDERSAAQGAAGTPRGAAHWRGARGARDPRSTLLPSGRTWRAQAEIKRQEGKNLCTSCSGKLKSRSRGRGDLAGGCWGEMGEHSQSWEPPGAEAFGENSIALPTTATSPPKARSFVPPLSPSCQVRGWEGMATSAAGQGREQIGWDSADHLGFPRSPSTSPRVPTPQRKEK
jgi:hypothetical protein